MRELKDRVYISIYGITVPLAITETQIVRAPGERPYHIITLRALTIRNKAEEIRKEAIKWIKVKGENPYKGCMNINCEMDAEIRAAEAVKEVLMDFFNIKEEELK